MGGISTGIGIFSGIDTASLIEQLLSVSSRPKVLAQQRLVQLQTQQAAYLDINSSLSALRQAAASFRSAKTFDAKTATSTNETALTATAGTGAQNGTYNFIVDRLVSTRQLLSRGFPDTDTSPVGIDRLSIESALARLDRETALADLNNGAGIARGKILINDTEVDLSRAATVRDVVDTINSTPGLNVTASISGGSFVLTSSADITLANVAGYTTVQSLGLGGNAVNNSGTYTLTGSSVYGLNANTALATLNDGRGVTISNKVGAFSHTSTTIGDLTIAVGADRVTVSLGEIYENGTDDEGKATFELVKGSVSTIGGVVNRINEALATNTNLAGLTAAINPATGGISITGGSGNVVVASINPTNPDGVTGAAEALGIAGTHAGGTVSGRRILAQINSTLTSSLNGGTGVGGDGTITFTTADGATAQVTGLLAQDSLEGLIAAINTQTAGAVTASINNAGTGIKIVDNTVGLNAFVIEGTDGADTAASLGIAGTHTGGTAAGANLQLAWIGLGTRLDTLNGGSGIGTGSFRITDSLGTIATIDVRASDTTLADVVKKINDSSANVTARINDTGDGIVVVDDAGGTIKMKIEDATGTVARELGIRGEAEGVGAENKLDGSYETVIEFDPNDTLDDVRRKINDAGVEAVASIINDGSGSTPNRLSLSGRDAGTAGRFVLDTGDFDLGLSVLDEGRDARVFFGSSDPARAVLLTSSSDTLDGVITGVSINLKSTSKDPVELSVTTNTTKIEEQVNAFVSAYNGILDTIDQYTGFVEETNQRGALLGDSTANTLRQRMFNISRASNTGFSEAFNNLASVGITIGDGARMQLNAERFRAALEEDPDAVRALFDTRVIDPSRGTTEFSQGITVSDPNAETQFSALGVIVQFEEFAADYINSIDGVLVLRNRALDAQIELQNQRITAFDAQLENQRTVLERRFLSMEQAIASLQTQSQSLAQLG